MTQGDEAAVLTIPASLAEIDRARVFLRERLRGLPMSGDDRFHFDLALFEILVNIVRYGFPGGEGEIRIDLRAEEGAVRLEIRDRGVPFNPEAAPPPALDEILAGRKRGGLGIYLARKFTDGLSYRREGAENVVVLRKAFKNPAVRVRPPARPSSGGTPGRSERREKSRGPRRPR